MFWLRGAMLALVAMLPACAAQPLRPFTTDGCSLFPDASPFTHETWAACCISHDEAYWRGGTAGQREKADRALEQCVLEATGDRQFASLMFAGVRAGGSPYFPTWYRWGYGWSYGRGYEPLTDKEQATADAMLRKRKDAK